MPKNGTKAFSRVSREEKRQYLSQADVPAYSLEQATRIARALSDNYGKKPTKPLRVAEAIDMLPQSSTFRMLCGASIAYGLTDGGYNSELISLSPLGRRTVAPTSEGDDDAARREALLRPRVIREFLQRYNDSKLPAEKIGHNVLEEMGVPRERASTVWNLIVEGARSVGFLRDVKGATFVDLDGTAMPTATQANEADSDQMAGSGEEERPAVANGSNPSKDAGGAPLQGSATAALSVGSRVFITHGKNREIVNQIKELLSFGGFTPVLAIEQETVSKPVPDKVMDEMRSCKAGIIHVGAEMKLLDTDGKEHKTLNQNVLIEIGAGMALYGRKFILLVEKGVTLPSNLQGLYEVRYEGDKLDYEATMKLLKAFNDFRA